MYTRSKARRDAIHEDSETEDEYVDAATFEDRDHTFYGDTDDNSLYEVTGLDTSTDEADATVLERTVTTPVTSRRTTRSRRASTRQAARRTSHRMDQSGDEGPNPIPARDQSGVINTMKTFMDMMSNTMGAMQAMINATLRTINDYRPHNTSLGLNRSNNGPIIQQSPERRGPASGDMVDRSTRHIESRPQRDISRSPHTVHEIPHMEQMSSHSRSAFHDVASRTHHAGSRSPQIGPRSTYYAGSRSHPGHARSPQIGPRSTHAGSRSHPGHSRSSQVEPRSTSHADQSRSHHTVTRSRHTLSRSRLTGSRSRHTSEDSDSDTDIQAPDSSPDSRKTSKLFKDKMTRGVTGKLPPFTGENWKVWYNRFEAVAQLSNWTRDEKLRQILPKIQGTAADFVYDQLRAQILTDYDALVKELNGRFGVIESGKTYRIKFDRHTQQRGESPEEFAAELKRLYDKAHPTRDSKTKQEDLVSHFLLGLFDEKARIHVELNKDPKTIEEAVLHVVNYSETTRYPHEGDTHHKDGSNRTRQVKQNDNKRHGNNKDGNKGNQGRQASKQNQRQEPQNHGAQTRSDGAVTVKREELREMIDEMMKQSGENRGTRQYRPRYNREQLDADKRDGLCFKCHQPGHFARDCQTWIEGQKQSSLDPNATEFKVRGSSQGIVKTGDSSATGLN